MINESVIMSKPLLIGGLCSTAIAVLHLAIIVVGTPGYRDFGAGEKLARLAEAGSSVPGLITLGIAAVFAVFAWHGFAGAGIAARPPLLRAGLALIACVFLARGISALPQLAALACAADRRRLNCS